jgi:MULE transposase domain
LALLVVVDNNTKSRLLAQYLLEDETTESYEWYIDCIIQATNNIAPICLFSDADPALMNAISSKIPTTHHFLLGLGAREIFEACPEGHAFDKGMPSVPRACPYENYDWLIYIDRLINKLIY